MQTFKILMSNLGYAKGINGCLSHHLRFAHRHLYCTQLVQEETLVQLRALIEVEDPDLCCFVEIDKGSFPSPGFNQLESVLSDHYGHSDIENKYGENSWLRRHPLTRGKSNAFMSKQHFPFKKLFFDAGAKRLLYQIQLTPTLTLFFAHFSLKQSVRTLQLQQVTQIVKDTGGEVILLGDFNILTGVKELKPLLEAQLKLLNPDNTPTFTLHTRRLMLDLCLCSPSLVPQSTLKILPQAYSDHAALLLELEPDLVKQNV